MTKIKTLIILRLANGDTYRLSYSFNPHGEALILIPLKANKYRLLTMGLGVGFRHILQTTYEDEYEFSEIIPGTDFLLHKMGSNRINIESVKHLSAIGMNPNAVHPGKFFFTEKKK